MEELRSWRRREERQGMYLQTKLPKTVVGKRRVGMTEKEGCPLRETR